MMLFRNARAGLQATKYGAFTIAGMLVRCFLGRYRSVSTTSPSKYDVDGMATAQDHVITRSHVSRSMRTYGTCLTRNAKAILKPVSACSTC
jgi:hypothetical protein